MWGGRRNCRQHCQTSRNQVLPGNLILLGKKFFPAECAAALKPLKIIGPLFGIEDAS